MASTKILVAGFGGQGVLFVGKILAYSGLLAGKQVSWLPSYGPEMRGGTANCSVIISDEPVGSPIVSEPDILIAMNRPSLEKYEKVVENGGYVFYDSSLINTTVERTDIKSFPIPATKLADDLGYHGLSNIMVLGKLVKESQILPLDIFEKAIEKVVPAKKIHLLPKNIEALKVGFNF